MFRLPRSFSPPNSVSRALRPAAVLLAAGLACGGSSVWAQGLSPDALKSELLISLAQPLPLTIIGPLMAPDIEIEAEGTTQHVRMPDARIMGFIPLGAVSFDLTDLGDKRYEVSNFALPDTIALGGGMELSIGSSTLTGIWSFETRSYETMRLNFKSVAVHVGGGSVELARLGALELAIDQQGKQDIDASLLSLSGVNLAADIPDVGPVLAGELSARVLVKTGQPLDLQSLITRSVQSAFLAPDQSQLVNLMGFLQERRYDLLQADVTLRDLDASLPDGPWRAGSASLRVDGTDLTLGELGRLSITVSGQDIHAMPDDDVTITMGQGNGTLGVSGLSIAKILAALQQVEAASHGMAVEGSLADFYDAFLGFDDVSLSLDVRDLFAINPEDDDLESFGFKALSVAQRLSGFKERRGEIAMNWVVDGFNVTLPDLKPEYDYSYNSETNEYERSEEPVDPSPRDVAERNLQRDMIALLAPESLSLNMSVSQLGDALAYDILKNLPIDENIETSWLALLAVLPTLEIHLISNADYRSQKGRLTANSDVVLVPMRATSFNAYTGTQTSQFEGWDAFMSEARRIIAETEDEILVIFDPYVAVMEAFGRPAGDDALTWDVVMDGEKDYMIINDRKFYIPDIASLFGLPAMMDAMDDIMRF